MYIYIYISYIYIYISHNISIHNVYRYCRYICNVLNKNNDNSEVNHNKHDTTYENRTDSIVIMISTYTNIQCINRYICIYIYTFLNKYIFFCGNKPIFKHNICSFFS